MLASKQGKIRIEDVNQASCDQNQKYCLFYHMSIIQPFST